MKFYHKCKLVRLVAGLGLAAAWSAKADTQLTIGYDTAYEGDILLAGAPGNLGAGTDSIYLTAFQASYQGGEALPLPTANGFFTFCFDVGQNISLAGSWQATPLSANPNGNTIPYISGGLQRAASLYNTYVSSTDISSAAGELNGAALQLAIWNDLYDGDTQVESGRFSVSGGNSAAVIAVADSFLQSSANVANPGLNNTFWNATQPVDNQDLIGPGMPAGFAPEPAAYAVAASVGALLVMLRTYAKEKRC